jgi:hypothetical protein
LSPYATLWLTAFAITLVVELVVAVPLLAPSGAGAARRAGVVVIANLATHPIVWFGFPQWGLPETVRLVASEFFAVALETAAYLLVWPALGATRAFGTSAVANGASLAVGLVLRALGVRV